MGRKRGGGNSLFKMEIVLKGCLKMECPRGRVLIFGRIRRDMKDSSIWVLEMGKGI